MGGDAMTVKQFQWGLFLITLCQFISLGKILVPNSDVSVQTMPILTPVSLEYEREFRAGQEPANLHMVIDAARHVDPTKVSKSDYTQFVADRMQMLELRNQRHALNVRLMQAGVEILEGLTPEQWTFVQSQRDSIKATHETKVMEEILEKWSQ